MATVSESNKKIARMAVAAFNADPTIVTYWDDNHRSSVEIVSCADSPQRNVTSCSTVRLSDWPLIKGGTEYPARTELVGACGSRYDRFPNILSTAAFCIINSRWFCYPGAMFPDIVWMYYDSFEMKHLLFAPPFLWEPGLETLHLPDKTVAWLMIVPISEAEYAYAEKHGSDRLEAEFERSQIDVFNLERPSIF